MSTHTSDRTTIEMSVTTVDYTEPDADGQPAIIHVFGRTEDRDAEHVRVYGFMPYFYVDQQALSPDAYDEMQADDRIVNIETGSEYKSIRGRDVLKVTARTPRDVRDLRDEYVDRHYEADVVFPLRFMLDEGITSGVRVTGKRADDGALEASPRSVEPIDLHVDPRVLFYDIEVDDSWGFPEDGQQEIISISSYDSYADFYRVWLYDPDWNADGDRRDRSFSDEFEMLDEDAEYEILPFKTEEQMLMAFCGYVDMINADVHCGWNFDDFDAPYLLDRLEILYEESDNEMLRPEQLSKIDEVWRSYYGPNIKGVVVLDLLYAYKRMVIQEKDSWALDAVAEDELGVGKERYSGTIYDLWQDDPERLCEYNLRDTELCAVLNDSLDLIPFWNQVASFVGCSLDEAPTPSSAVDAHLLREANERFVLPSKGGSSEAEEYEGAEVFEPQSGILEDVAALDLASLYPMSMVTINASPETKVDPETFDGEYLEAPNGVCFRADVDGFIKEIIDDLLDERDELKDKRDANPEGSDAYERYDRQQRCVKVIMNSLYGVSGWQRFRLYDAESAAAVTAVGREVITFTETALGECGYNVKYGDTDSVMFETGVDGETDDEIKERAMEVGFEVEEYINDRYDDFAREQLNAEEHRFELEFEKLYRRFLQAGKKKRYAGHIVWKEGKDVDKIDVTGFEYTRSDVAKITKEVQYDVIEMLVRDGDIETVESYIRDVVERIECGLVPLDKLAAPGGIGKPLCRYDSDTRSVRAAKYANLLLGTEFQSGMKPKVVELAGIDPAYFERLEREQGFDPIANPMYGEFKEDPSHIGFEHVDQLPPEFAVDFEEMATRAIKDPVGRVLKALDRDVDEIVRGDTQSALDAFGD